MSESETHTKGQPSNRDSIVELCRDHTAQARPTNPRIEPSLPRRGRDGLAGEHCLSYYFFFPLPSFWSGSFGSNRSAIVAAACCRASLPAINSVDSVTRSV